MASLLSPFRKLGQIFTGKNSATVSVSRYNPYARMGGYRNPHTGAGEIRGDGDFSPTRITSRSHMEVIAVESWAAKKFISIPVNDMFVEWREFNVDKETATQMENAERKHKVQQQLAKAMRAARKQGTGLLVMVTREAPLEEPLDINALKPGDLETLKVFDRFDCPIQPLIDENPFSPFDGDVLEYNFTMRNRQRNITIDVHPSRVIRFDGIMPDTDTGWSQYTAHWGVSELVPVILSILQYASVSSAVNHLMSETSIPVIKMSNFREALAAGGIEPDDVSPEQMGQKINEMKSVYRTLFLDLEDEFMRVAVNYSGIPQILNEFALSLAAAADIPATRFWAQSPKGMNATGESDERNYALHIASQQKALLTDPLARLDEVLAIDAGLDEPPPYTFRSLIDVSDHERATIANLKADALYKIVLSGLASRDEARQMLDGDALFGNLDGPAPAELELQTAGDTAPQTPTPDSPAEKPRGTRENPRGNEVQSSYLSD